MQLQKITGIILNKQAHADLDRIVTVFSRECGIIRIFAKGVKNIRSHRGFHLDIFNHVVMELEQSGAQVTPLARKYLREVSTICSFNRMKGNMPSISAAYIVAEFLLRIIPQSVSQKKLFQLTKRTFESLNDRSESNVILLTFFLKALRLLGHLPPTLPKNRLRETLWNTLNALDPEFTLSARRTFGIFDVPSVYS